MSRQSINNYYNKLSQYKRFGGTRNETSIRRAFANLLEEYCLPKNLILVDELQLKNSAKRPDGTIKDALQLDWGFWESKDQKDNLDNEIDKKIEIGYPTFNIIFENSEQIVLIQQSEEKMRGEMDDADFLHRVLTAFVGYERPEIKEFHTAIEKFKEDIPDIVEALRSMIAEQADKNPDFRIQREKFWNVCRESINPEISAFDIREMLIQHILTAEIFDTVFGDSHFHRENNIARELETVVNTFFTGSVRRDTLATVDNYYKTIKREASNIDNHHEKQKFLKVIYETFYKAYNPKGADRLGVVYTPNEIVKFMVESTDYLLEKHFGKSMADKNVQILDPATGTGTFITDIIEYIPPKYLKHKFKNEIHCNELAILPYYIANLNIEYTYQQKMDKYEPFENIVFVDTLDNLGFGYSDKQHSLFVMTAENLERIKRQNSKEISVIIGNPPYNANQMNENDNNRNRNYPQIDKIIKKTYVKYSTAQKSKVYDMYSRFYRWASDRINEDGIICFITNNSFINSRTFDGFRKSIEKEFDYAYIIDLGGNIRELSGKDGIFLGEKHTIFGLSAMVGISIMFLVKSKENTNEKCQIKYIHPCDIRATRREKLEYLQYNPFKNIPFEVIHPDKKNNWVDLANNDFDELIKLYEKQEKKLLFLSSSNGISTNRDEWVYDFDKSNIINKGNFFIDEYNKELDRWTEYIKNNKYKDIKKEANPVVDKFLEERNHIKWSKMIKRDKFRKFKFGKFNVSDISDCLYRPFTLKKMNFGYIPIDLKGSFTSYFPSKDKQNKLMAINKSGKDFYLLSSNRLVDLHFTGDSQCLPLYSYDKSGNRIENITDWGLKQFTEHYKTEKISKEDIFHYTYGVLHNPAYRKKYELNLKREFPRLPFYKNFEKWVNWGKKLMDLHINYETVEPFKLRISEADKIKEIPKAKLRRNKETNEITLDENTSILNIPDIALDYKLGNRSAIDWILDQYKEKKPRDKTIAEKFNTYKFADYKNRVIDLIKRVTTVSVRTMEIVNQMEAEESHNDKDKK